MTSLYVGARPDDLVPGNPADLDRLVARCRSVADGLGGAAARLRAIDAGEWVGPAGDAFRGVVDVEPGRYDDAAAAFGATGSAVRGYAEVLRDAQGSARSRGHAVRAGRDGHRALVAAGRAARRTTRGPTTAPAPRRCSPTPGSGSPTPAPLRRGRSVRPGPTRRASRTGGSSAGHFVAEIGRGAWEATAGMVEFAWSVSTVRMLVDPDGWASDMQALGDRPGLRRHPSGRARQGAGRLGHLAGVAGPGDRPPAARPAAHPGHRRRRRGGPRAPAACRRWTTSPTWAPPSSGWTGSASRGSG